MLSSKISQVPVANQLSALLIPETIGEGLEAGEESERLDALEKRVRTVAPFKVVIGNARTQMMNVMKTDIA